MANGSAPVDFRQVRKRGVTYIALAAPVTVGVWLSIAELAPAVPSMETLAARMVFTLKCLGLAVCMVLGCGVTGRA